MHAPTTSRDHYSLSYSQFVVPLVQSVQELAKQNDALQAENAQLRQQLQAVQTSQSALDARLSALEQVARPAAAAPVAQASR